MHTKLLLTFTLSLFICALNYVAAKASKLGSARAILLDSVLDLFYPLTSMVALCYTNLDQIISSVQFLIIIATTSYFAFDKIRSKPEQIDNPALTMICMILSTILSVMCILITKGLVASMTPLLSLQVILTHFQIDLISKLCVIFITLLNKTELPNKRKLKLTRIFDLTSMGLIVFTTIHSFYIFVRGG